MADEVESEEGTVEEVETETEPKPKSPGKEMREKLETTLSENADLKGKLMLHEAGLTSLTDRQRKAVLRDATEDGKEPTVDTLKEAAKELGFNAAPKEKPKGTGDESTPPADSGEDDETTEALNSMDAVDRAVRQSRGAVDPDSFEAKIKAAKSQEEVEGLIRSEGHKVGIVHEWDVE